MLGIVRLAVESVGDRSNNAGISVIVLSLYGAVFVVALIAWIAWGIRQERGGVIQWGEPRTRRGIGLRRGRSGKRASVQAEPAAPPLPLQFFDYDRERHAG
jgi:hypothetical protein